MAPTPTPHSHDAPGQGGFEDAPVHSLDGVAEITQISRHLVAVYCRHGLIAPLDEVEHGGWAFDDEAVRKLRRMEAMRSAFGVNLAGLHLIEELQRELDLLLEEVRFLRGRGY